jgi:UDP-apiose/xylose synthase
VDGGRQRRSFVWIGDFVDAIVRLLDRPAQAQGQIFNLGAPENDLSVRGLAEALSRAYAAVVPDAPAARLEEVTAEAFYGPGYDDTEARIPDIGSAILRLDWRPQTTLTEMLPPIVADYVARYTPLLAAERLKVAT